MMGPGIPWYLAISSILFSIGVAGVLLRRSPLIVLLSLEIMRSGDAPATGAVLAAGGSPPRDLLLDVTLGAALAVTIGSFFFVQPLVDLASDAAASLPFL